MRSLTKIQNFQNSISSNKSLRKVILDDYKQLNYLVQSNQKKCPSKSSSLKILNVKNNKNQSTNIITKYSLNQINKNKFNSKQRKRNIMKFQSKVQEIQPNLRHIWLKQYPQTCNQIFLPVIQQQHVMSHLKQIKSLKSIRQIQNIHLPCPQTTTNLIHSHLAHESKPNKNIKRLRLTSKFQHLSDGKQNVNHNTSIIADTNRDYDIKEKNIKKKKINQTDFLSESLGKDHPLRFQNLNDKNFVSWQQASLDLFEQKLQSLMIKAKRNSQSRIDLINSKYPKAITLDYKIQ